MKGREFLGKDRAERLLSRYKRCTSDTCQQQFLHYCTNQSSLEGSGGDDVCAYTQPRRNSSDTSIGEPKKARQQNQTVLVQAGSKLLIVFLHSETRFKEKRGRTFYLFKKYKDNEQETHL